MKELLGLIADVNPNEIAAHIADGTLAECDARLGDRLRLGRQKTSDYPKRIEK